MSESNSLTKTDLRQQLGDENFFYLVFIKFSMPSLEAVDWEPILKRWYEDGHNNALSRAAHLGGGDGIVLKRLAKEHARRNHTPSRGARHGGYWYVG